MRLLFLLLLTGCAAPGFREGRVATLPEGRVGFPPSWSEDGRTVVCQLIEGAWTQRVLVNGRPVGDPWDCV
jgi:hypothetical protein